MRRGRSRTERPSQTQRVLTFLISGQGGCRKRCVQDGVGRSQLRLARLCSMLFPSSSMPLLLALR
eukprot:6219153-Pyramimonas_sp.AAC.1